MDDQVLLEIRDLLREIRDLFREEKRYADEAIQRQEKAKINLERMMGSFGLGEMVKNLTSDQGEGKDGNQLPHRMGR